MKKHMNHCLGLGMAALAVSMFLGLSCTAPINDDPEENQISVEKGSRVTIRVNTSLSTNRSFTEERVKDMIDYYEVIFKEHGTSRYERIGTAEKGKSVLSVEVTAGARYDILLMAGVKKNRLLLASSFYDGDGTGKLIEEHKNNVITLTLNPIVVNAENPASFEFTYGVFTTPGTPPDTQGSAVAASRSASKYNNAAYIHIDKGTTVIPFDTKIVVGNITPLIKAVGGEDYFMVDKNWLTLSRTNDQYYFNSINPSLSTASAIATIFNTGSTPSFTDDFGTLDTDFSALEGLVTAVQTALDALGSAGSATLGADSRWTTAYAYASEIVQDVLDNIDKITFSTLVSTDIGNASTAIVLLTTVSEVKAELLDVYNTGLELKTIAYNIIYGDIPKLEEVITSTAAIATAIDSSRISEISALTAAMGAVTSGLTTPITSTEAAAGVLAKLWYAMNNCAEGVVDETTGTITTTYTILPAYLPNKDITGKLYFELAYIPFGDRNSGGNIWYIRNASNYDPDRNDNGGAILVEIGDGSPLPGVEVPVIPEN